MRERPVIVSEDDGLRVATWQNVMMLFWYGEVSAERLKPTKAIQRAILARYAQGSAVLTVVSAQTPLSMSSAAREEATLQQKEFSKTHVGMATVIEGTGFFKSTARSIASGITLFSRPIAPTRIFDTVEEAVRWLAPLLAAKAAADITESEVLEAVQAARSAPKK
jgi:hypothetical protein